MFSEDAVGWLKSWEFNRALNCPRLMDVERRWTGRALQTTDALSIVDVLFCRAGSVVQGATLA